MGTPKTESDPIIVAEQYHLFRIDQFLAHYFNKSRSYFQFLIDQGYVCLNGKKVKKRYLVKKNDVITVFFLELPQISLKPEDIPLDIIYEDDHILAINKPAGLVVHPAPGNPSATFVNALLYHYKDLIVQNGDIRPGIVHRLDKNTTGILLAAKTYQAHQALIQQFQKRELKKDYLAICFGKVPNITLQTAIARHPIKRKEMTVSEKGKEAITHFRNLDYDGKLSLVHAKIDTGRTHQIRVHLQHLNTPILGDETYGNKRANACYKTTRPLLHAYKLKFPHPITSQILELTAPIPEDFKKRFTKSIKNQLFLA